MTTKHPDCVALMCGVHDCGAKGPCYIAGPMSDSGEARVAEIREQLATLNDNVMRRLAIIDGKPYPIEFIAAAPSSIEFLLGEVSSLAESLREARATIERLENPNER